MTTLRQYSISAAIVVAVGWQVTVVALDKEIWPFSQWPMYSHIEGPTMTHLVVVGVRRNDSAGAELPLEPKHLAPLDKWRLTAALKTTLKRPTEERAPERALRTIFEHYDRTREVHGGPPIVGTRLYAITWTLRPNAENRDRPDARELLAEYRLPNSGAE
jgi:hypothetical protein